MGNGPLSVCLGGSGEKTWEGQAYVALTGLENVGKTSICLSLLNSEERPKPTGMEDCLKTNKQSAMRLNEWVLRLRFNRTVHMMDLGGKEEYHSMWSKRYINVLCMVFVIDASDTENWDSKVVPAYKKHVQPHLMSARIPVLFVVNKTDLVAAGTDKGRVTHEMVKKDLQLEDDIMAPDHFDVCDTSVVTKEGLGEMLDRILLLIHACKKRYNQGE